MALANGLATDRRRQILALAAAYAVTGAAGLLLAIPPGYATAVWPASGLALAAVLRFGPRVWPGIWLGSFVINSAVALGGQSATGSFTALAIAAGIGAGSTLQALIAAWLLRTLVGVGRIFESGPKVFAFAGILAFGCLLAPTWGAGTLTLAGVLDTAAYFDSWRTWWLGDLIGVLTVAPLLLNWQRILPAGRARWQQLEFYGSQALLVAVTALVFFGQPALTSIAYPLTFLPLPLLVWIACRTTPGGVALATCLISAIAIVATSLGLGPFALETTNHSLLLLQGFTGLNTLMALALSAAVTGHRQAEDELRALSSELQHLAITDDLTGLRNRRGFLLLAEQARKLAHRTRARCLLVFIDIDGLKRVNDTFGHREGDALILDAARVLAAVFRDTDVIARVGGDEFAVLALSEGARSAETIGRRLQARIDELNQQSGRRYALAMSYGIEELPAATHLSLEEQLARADHAMYATKRERRRRKRASPDDPARGRQAKLF